MSRLTETALTFGKNGRLLGVLTVPENADLSHPMLVIPNTGLEHRVGPNRLHVHVARALSARGYCSFRFDIAGLGDSDPEVGKKASSRDDLTEALNLLVSRGFGPQFNLLGLCSGAHDSLQFALHDDRVSGLFLIDGYAYPTPRFQRMLWANRITHLGRSLKRFAKRIERLRGTLPESQPPGLALSLEPWPSREEANRAYEALLARGTHLAFLFTGDVQGEYLYTEQHYDCFPFLRGHARLWYMPEMDHTLTRIASRQKVIELARDWLISSAA